MNAVVNWFRSVTRFIYDVTGITEKQKKALRSAKDWVQTISEFIEKHDINDDVDVEKILAYGGDIKFELTTLNYNGRLLTEHAEKLRNKQAARLIGEISDNLDIIRRYMFSPALQKERLRQALIILRSSSIMLQKILAEIENR